MPPRKTPPGYWEGEMVVMNMTENLKLKIIAPISGPAAAQEGFLRMIVENFDSLTKAVQPFLKAAFEDVTGQTYPEVFRNEFIWTHLSIPEEGERTNQWDISFTCKSGNQHLFTIYFDKGNPVQAISQ